jgi:hypothetical protein
MYSICVIGIQIGPSGVRALPLAAGINVGINGIFFSFSPLYSLSLHSMLNMVTIQKKVRAVSLGLPGSNLLNKLNSTKNNLA